MVMEFRVTQNLKNIERGLSEAQRKVIPAAANSAINRTARAMRTVAVKSVRKQIGARAKTVRDAIKLERSTRRTLTAKLQFSKTPINLIEYLPKGKRVVGAFDSKPGVVARTPTKTTYRRTFIALGPRSNKLQVFRRLTADRGPLIAVAGPSPFARLKSRSTRRLLDKKGKEVFQGLLERDLKFRLAKLDKKKAL